jgi:hypothetical protein
MEDLKTIYDITCKTYGELVGSIYPSVVYRDLIEMKAKLAENSIYVNLPPPPNIYGYSGGMAPK